MRPQCRTQNPKHRISNVQPILLHSGGYRGCGSLASIPKAGAKAPRSIPRFPLRKQYLVLTSRVRIPIPRQSAQLVMLTSIAQLVGHLSRQQSVAGSNPAAKQTASHLERSTSLRFRRRSYYIPGSEAGPRVTACLLYFGI